MALIAEVILPVPIKSNFQYLVRPTHAAQVQIGKRVLVQFGTRKIYTGVIRDLSEGKEESFDIPLKPLEEVLDEIPVLGPSQLALFKWISFYYMCTEGEVLKAALPAGLKPESAMKIELNPGVDWEKAKLDDKEFMLVEALSIQPVLTFKEVSDIWDMVNPNPRLKVMEQRHYIRTYQQVEEKYKPRYKTFLKLKEAYTEEDALRRVFDQFTSKQESQENLLMRVVEAFYKDKPLPKSETLKELNIGSHVVKQLVKKGILTEEKIQIDRMELYGYEIKPKSIVPNEGQQRVLREIRSYFTEQLSRPVLLHGITGSGKTLIYIELIKEQLAAGKQVLYLLPEITLTKQIIDRVRNELGTKVGIYHSKFNDHERVEIWQKVQRREYEVVIGVRSSIFLPFQELGLIVVDEEHDTSFKQHEPAPRYHARDLAIYYAKQEGIPILLGSATPAFESYRNALLGKYALVELHKRAIAAQMPDIHIVDMRLQKKKRLQKGIFSSVLMEALQETLSKGEQAILFQNRRGYSPYLICETCGNVPQCINCDISLTFHKEKQHLRCHYCGYTTFQQNQCSYCNHYTLRRAGIGTERIEEEVLEYFPEYTVQRMDLDTTRTKLGFQQIINRFENKQIDILVGTQMVSKGLDFENVTLVGVIHADHILSFPDFRAYEYGHQLLTQVSGRAGRSTKKGQVIIQALAPENVVLQSIANPYADFYHAEIDHRKPLHYPPYTRLIRIEFRHKDKEFIEKESLRLNSILKPFFGNNLLGPDYALVARVRNQYRMQFLIKLTKKISSHGLREKLQQLIDNYYEKAPVKTLRIIVDVDPV